MAEEQLLQRAQAGDRSAIEELFGREWRPIYGLVYRTVQNRSEAQDLTQEVFLRAFRSLDGFRDTGKPFHAYLTTIALNLLRDRWRTRKPPSADLASMPPLPSGEPGPEGRALATADREVIHAALKSLAEDHQTVIRLRVLEARSSKEVAELMNRNPDAIRQLQRRALVALRATLREESLL